MLPALGQLWYPPFSGSLNKGRKKERGTNICIFSLEKAGGEWGGVYGQSREGWYHTFRPILSTEAVKPGVQSQLGIRGWLIAPSRNQNSKPEFFFFHFTFSPGFVQSRSFDPQGQNHWKMKLGRSF